MPSSSTFSGVLNCNLAVTATGDQYTADIEYLLGFKAEKSQIHTHIYSSGGPYLLFALKN